MISSYYANIKYQYYIQFSEPLLSLMPDIRIVPLSNPIKPNTNGAVNGAYGFGKPCTNFVLMAFQWMRISERRHYHIYFIWTFLQFQGITVMHIAKPKCVSSIEKFNSIKKCKILSTLFLLLFCLDLLFAVFEIYESN